MATIETTDPAREVLNQAPPLQPVDLFERRPRAAARRWSARAAAGAPRGRTWSARSPAAPRRASTAAAPSATSRA